MTDIDELPPPIPPGKKDFTWDREAQLIDDLWKMRVERDSWRTLALQGFMVIILGMILGGILLAAIWNASQKDVNVNFEPEMIRYTPTLVNNNIQAPHVIFPKDELLAKWDSMGPLTDWGPLYGHSMEPTFFHGNTAMLLNLTPGFVLKPGQIVRFFRTENNTCYSGQESEANQVGGSWVNNSMAVIHRITAYYDDDSIVVMGDNLLELESIKRCQITHVVVGIVFT